MTHSNESARDAQRVSTAETRAVLDDPAFRELVRERSTFSWFLSALIFAVYLTFILLVAFFHDLVATPIGSGPTSLGIVLGLVVIVFAFVLTGIYVSRANGRFDDLTARIKGGR